MKPEHPWFLKTSAYLKPGCAALFGLPFLVGGLFCLWSMTLHPALEWWHARSWVEANAVIEKAWLKVTRGSDDDSYEVAVDFRYLYHGMAHTGSRHSFVSSSTKLLRNAHWGAWWQLEVTHDDGTLEMPDLTKAVKLEA